MDARKISFQEAWDSSVVFLVDEALEQEIEAEVEALLETARNHRVSETATITVDSIADFLAQRKNALEVILKDIELSEEKFLRIISLLRKLQRIPGGFDAEWGIGTIKRKMSQDQGFVRLIAQLLIDGKHDKELQQYIPRYYLDTLNYREIKGSSEAARRIRYKRLLIGTYGAGKGHRVEGRIRQKLAEIEARWGVGCASGRSQLIETDIDFAVPNLEDPYVIIMSSFQETTSSGQTTKAKDMRTAYEGICHINSRNREDRAFVNFVDGGGWLARKRDLERLVKDCHYFINLHHLDMLEAIVLKHVPRKYFGQG
jgi:hypothetical protein